MEAEAMEFTAEWMKNSHEYMRTKLSALKLWEDLYYNRRPLNEWSTKTRYHLYREVPAAKRIEEMLSGIAWRSNNVIAIQPIVDSYVERAHGIVFGQPDYFTVKPRPRANQVSTEDGQHSTSDKLQRLLIETSDDMEFSVRMEELLKSALMFGVGVSKTPWYEDAATVAIHIRNPESGELIPTGETKRVVYRRGVDVRKIKLHRFLPDPLAETHNINLWSGIGDITHVPYHQILKDFQTPDNPGGQFNLNLEAFIERWQDGGIQDYAGSDEVGLRLESDPDWEFSPSASPIKALKLWERHGWLKFSNIPEPVEGVVTICTGLNSSDPKSGVMIRLELKPLLDIRRRPYLSFPFILTGGPLGMGVIEANLDLIWQISHLENIFIDACRICSIPLIAADANSPIFEESDEADLADVLFPAKIFKTNGPQDIQAFSLSAGDLASIANAIDRKKQELRERTAVSDTSRGVEGTQRKTASEVSVLFQQGQSSLGPRINRFRDTVMVPYGKIALSHFKQNITENQELWMQSSAGPPQPVTLTVEEIRDGDYDVGACFDLPQEAKVARAQNIVQMWPAMQQLEPTLMMRFGKKILWPNEIEAANKLLGNADSTKALDDATEDDFNKFLMMMGGAPPPGNQEQQETGPDGGPIGSEPSDANTAMAEQQMNAQAAGPVPMGSGSPA